MPAQARADWIGGLGDHPEEMTPAQYQELATCYNGGPYWETDDAQDYRRGFANNLDEARNALR